MPIPSGDPLPLLDDLLAHMQTTAASLTGTDSEDELQNVLDAAVETLGRRCGPLYPKTKTERVSGCYGGPLILNYTPVIEVLSVAYTNGTTVDVDDLDVQENGLIGWNDGTTGYWTSGNRNVTVTYTYGRSSLDPDLRLAVLELASDLWSRTQRGGGTSRPQVGVVPDDTTTFIGGRPLLPPLVEELIEPYLLRGGIG